jgi:heterodisulfide reductase subunit A
MTYTEVKAVNKNGDGYQAQLVKHPRYVDEDLCTGCRQCEYACPIDVPAAFDLGYGAHRAIRVPFSTAVPQYAVLDIEHCLVCGKCEKVCAVSAIDFSQTDQEIQLDVGAIVLATGFETTPRDAKKEYGAGNFPNVIDALFMERLLAPTGPYGHVLRPGDGKEPDSIAYVQCAGSRDDTLGIEYCSRVCCMYAIKQAQLLSGALPLADITIYYMDIRTFGKGYEQFYKNAEAMGIQFIKGKVAKITEDENKNPVVHVEMVDAAPRLVQNTHDLVVLSVGMVPRYDPRRLYNVKTASDGFIDMPSPNMAPSQTNDPGIFATGTAVGPMDIVDSIVMASACASETSAYLRSKGYWRASPTKEHATEKEALHA